MTGTAAISFAPLTGWDHLVQSINILLTTPKGTRVLHRDYGSDLPELIDRPQNLFNILDVFVAVADALDEWEKRFGLTNVDLIKTGADGQIIISMTGIYYPRGHLDDFTPANDNERTVQVVFDQAAA